MVFVVCLIVGQTALLVVTMTIAGVLHEAQENAYQSFSEKVDNRKSYIEREMSNRWTKFNPYLHVLSDMLPLEKSEQSREQFLNEAAPVLISMLRTTMTTGTFILLTGIDGAIFILKRQRIFFLNLKPVELLLVFQGMSFRYFCMDLILKHKLESLWNGFMRNLTQALFFSLKDNGIFRFQLVCIG